MMDKASALQNFHSLGENDKDLTMFVIKDLSLSKRGALVVMDIVLKRKISKELLTTFLPTVLLLLITFTSILFDENLFGDALAVNLTIMLVMTTIFTSKIEGLPSTSDTKMIDIWLIGCLLVPFTEVVLRTMIEVLRHDCNCKSLDHMGEDISGGGRKTNGSKAAWEESSRDDAILNLEKVVLTENKRMVVMRGRP